MLEMKVEKITPAKAKEYLKRNVNNPRGKNSLNRRIVKTYAEDMINGRWELNGECLVFDEDGYLKDGQHRLAAILLSGKTIEMCVIRGVGRDVDIFDVGWKRTVSQMVNAASDGEIDCNPSISSAAGIVVNAFRPSQGTGNLKNYIQAHFTELDRAYRITCYGGNNGHPKSKCAPCIAGTYLAIRTEAIPSYELELFYRIFNAKNNYSSNGYDPSPAVVARRMFDQRSSSGYQIQKEKLEIIAMALLDFHNGGHQEEDYKIAEPFHFSEWMNIVRRKDGLDV